MRLKSCCEQFAVRQIPVQHAKPYEYEVALLGDFSHYRSREVYLQGDGVDWIFARSLWPDVAPCTVLNELANQPLGSLLFASEQKGNVARHYGYLELAEQTLWARLSIYSYRSIPVLVQELFLPESPAYRRHVNGQ
ncbi:Chorismate pyruvate-lyase [Celerinatantimonas diazotrophica]|nr:Chorismate pyruvate-lyase [Celerinatantimonas diazotrophica]